MKPQQKNFRNWTIVRGDLVKILAGDDRGKKGKVVKVLRKLNRVVVKNININ
jgi:ribosomal protein L24